MFRASAVVTRMDERSIRHDDEFGRLSASGPMTPETAELVEDVRLPTRVRQAIGRTQSARRDAQRGREKAHNEMVKAARTLVDELGLGLRDAGELLNVSHQRVQQLTRAPRGAARAARS